MKKLFNKIQDWFAQISKESHLHFEFTTGISYIVSKVLQYCSSRDSISAAMFGAVTAFNIGLIKKFFIDYIWRNEVFDWNDIKANLIGSITGATMSLA